MSQMSRNVSEARMTGDDFVCVGCGEIFFWNVATRCSGAGAHGLHERLFHSPECMAAWSQRQWQDRRTVPG